MAVQKSISEYRSLVLEHGKRRRQMEQEQRTERDEMLARHKAEYEQLKRRQEMAMYHLRSRLLIEEKELRQGKRIKGPVEKVRQVCRRSMACLTNGVLKPERIDPVALSPIPEKRRREEVRRREEEAFFVCEILIESFFIIGPVRTQAKAN